MLESLWFRGTPSDRLYAPIGGSALGRLVIRSIDETASETPASPKALPHSLRIA
ncbi:MAG TPA: hypothetical protein VI895_11895 [Bdellovibrionota bacterium]|nr:hypothetical protein [Bdellovibrionota bacterium]